jgi:hypothetical protein
MLRRGGWCGPAAGPRSSSPAARSPGGAASGLGGGAIFATGGSRVVIIGTWIEGNQACNRSASATGTTSRRELLSATDQGSSSPAGSGQGGAVYATNGSTIDLHNVTLANNSADWRGGGVVVCNGSKLVVQDSVLSANSALGGEGGGVLVMSIDSTARVVGSNFSGNSAWEGTALYVGTGGEGELQHSAIRGEGNGLSAVGGVGQVALVGVSVSGLPPGMPSALRVGGKGGRLRIDYSTFSLAPTQSAIIATSAEPVFFRNSHLQCQGAAACLGSIQSVVDCAAGACGAGALCQDSPLGGVTCTCPATWIGKSSATGSACLI